MARSRIRFEPPSLLLEDYFRDRSVFSTIRGPLGSGKTQTTILKLLAMMREQTPNGNGVRQTRLLIIRNTYPDLVTTTIKDWAAVTRGLAQVKMAHPPCQMIKYRMEDGTRVECDVVFVALDREDHVRKLRGFQGTFAWLNEMKELPLAVIEMTDARLGRYPNYAQCGVDCDHPGMVVGDTNAPDSDHWYAVKEMDTPSGWTMHVQPGAVFQMGETWTVNPNADNIQNLPPGYYEKLLQGKREDWIKVNLANEYGSAVDGKPIFPEFTSALHVGEFSPNADEPILFGMDFGLTPAMAMAQDHDGQLRIFDEIVTEDYSAQELALEAKRRKGTHWPHLEWGHGWGDPSNPRSQADKNTPILAMQAEGFDIFRAPTNDFTLRRDGVGNRLKSNTGQGKPSILIHPRCKILIKGLSGHYMYKRLKVVGDERYRDVPDKTIYSHVCEALQYLCMGLGDGDTLLGGDSYSGYPSWDTPINRPMRRGRALGHNRG